MLVREKQGREGRASKIFIITPGGCEGAIKGRQGRAGDGVGTIRQCENKVTNWFLITSELRTLQRTQPSQPAIAQ